MNVGAHHAKIRVAVLEVIAADQLGVGLDLVRIVDVVRLEEAEEIHLARGHDLAQAPRRIGLVADEVDLDDASLRPLVDREHDVDAPVRQLDHARRHLRGGAADAAVDLLDMRDVRVDRRLLERPAGLRLQLGLERVAGELPVALDHHAVDRGQLADVDDDPVALARQADVREQSGLQHGAAGLLEGPRAGHVGAHRLRVDAAVALDDDLLGTSGPGHRRHGRDGKSRGHNPRRDHPADRVHHHHQLSVSLMLLPKQAPIRRIAHASSAQAPLLTPASGKGHRG